MPRYEGGVQLDDCMLTNASNKTFLNERVKMNILFFKRLECSQGRFSNQAGAIYQPSQYCRVPKGVSCFLFNARK